MRMIDVQAGGEVDENGVASLTITAKGLTFDEVAEIADRIHAPFQAILNDVLSKGGTVQLVHRNMMEKPQ